MNASVMLSRGEVVLRKPLAGSRNKALMKAEGPDGIKQTVLMVELLPYCILSHPFGMEPVKQALDNLEMDEYDKLIKALADLIAPKEGEAKKSEKPSEEEGATA